MQPRLVVMYTGANVYVHVRSNFHINSLPTNLITTLTLHQLNQIRLWSIRHSTSSSFSRSTPSRP